MSDYSTILQRMLGRVPPGQDQRPSSPIFNTLSPTAAELAQFQVSVDIFLDQTYLLTAVGVNLDNRAADHGIVRRQATNAVRIAEMFDTDNQPMDLPIGSRFATPNVNGGVNFALIENVDPGIALLESETPGSVGNEYLGPLLPLFAINNLGTATMIGTQIPAENTETDESLRQRVIDRINLKSYGGNVADYKEFTTAIEGVGTVKVFPVWNGGISPSMLVPPSSFNSWFSNVIGIPFEIMEWLDLIAGAAQSGKISVGGTVLLSIIDGDLMPVTDNFIEVVQNIIDPIPFSGQGLGVAPIGHRVTVVTPDTVYIDIAADVSLRAGYTIPQLQSSIEAAIDEYIETLRDDWDDAIVLRVFIARINSAIINVVGVDNVTNITINGFPLDYELTQSAELQQLPRLGEVVLRNA